MYHGPSIEEEFAEAFPKLFNNWMKVRDRKVVNVNFQKNTAKKISMMFLAKFETERQRKLNPV